MTLADDLEFLVVKFEEMMELVRDLGIKREFELFRRAAKDVVREGHICTTDVGYRNLVSGMGAINHRADELLEKIWCWHERHRSTGMVAEAIAFLKKVVLLHFGVAKQLKEFKSEYDRMLKPEAAAGTAASAYSKGRTTSPADPQLMSQIVGRDEDVENIIRRMRQDKEDDDQQLHIIPIVGMPGIGKTTVAQMVYAHPWVEDSFDLRFWVHVSPCFNHKLVLRCMAKEVDPQGASLVEDEAVELLTEKLSGRTRYLLVLEDVWNEDHEEWGALNEQLLGISGVAKSAQGTVIVTTPRHSVAEMMTAAKSSAPPRVFEGLSANVDSIINWMRKEKELEKDEPKLHITAIVGMPDQIAVAQAVYDHPWVEDSFDLRFWVHVLPCFNHKLVLRCMAKEVDPQGASLVEDEAVELLTEKLSGRTRYLLVLEDVWNEDHKEWGALNEQLLEISRVAKGAQGTVIVTTPRHSVAEMMTAAKSSAPPRVFQGLSANVDSIINWMRKEKELEKDEPKLHITAIVEMPDQIAVAQAVYDHPWVMDSFDIRFWVKARSCFDHKLVLRLMAKSVASEGDSVDDDKKVDKLLKEKLKRRTRRYLLVLDDVWNEDQDKWGALKTRLLRIYARAESAQGTVIVTTPRHGVAEMIMAAANSSARPYELQGLSKDACWKLLRQRLPEAKLEALPLQEIRDAVDSIVHERCCGVPVAALEFAKQIMNSSSQVSGFSSLEPSTLIDPLLGSGGSLSLSHELLPIHLRNCIRFCSLFPEDHNYDGVGVGDIWRALNYASSFTSCKPSSDFDRLRREGFFHQPEHCYSTDHDKVTRYYKMNYLMHQLAAHLNAQPQPTFLTMRMDTTKAKQPAQSYLHLSLIVDAETSAFARFSFSTRKLKTLILLRETGMVLSNRRCKISAIPVELLANVRDLCVLDLQHTMIKKLPRAVEGLLHLRYLNLSETDITTIPEWVGRLRGLMFLNLVNCRCLRKLDDAVGNLDRLRKLDLAGCLFLVRVPDITLGMDRRLECLNFKDCMSLNRMPGDISRFSRLRVLPRYIVGENDGSAISNLGKLRALEGELRIENLDKVLADPADASTTAGLENKKMLKSLTLHWSWNYPVEDEEAIETMERVFDGLRPNENLIKLEIVSYLGKRFPSWMSPTPTQPCLLTSLQEIRLFNIKGCQALPPLGVLPRLRVAEISGMDAVSEVDEDFYGRHRGHGRHDGTFFPCLQKLTFSQMPKLKKWSMVGESDDRDMFPSLTNLTIIHCPVLVALEMELRHVTELTMWLNNAGLYNSKGSMRGLTASLKKLSISLCEELSESSQCEGLQDLRALEVLEISGCPQLTDLPRGVRHFTSLRSVCINGRDLLLRK